MEKYKNPFINYLKINLYGGILNLDLSFKNGLNIISGENGTGKTQILQLLKNGPADVKKFNDDKATDRIVLFNPIRNSEKKNLNEIENKLRSNGVSRKIINETLRSISMQTWQVQAYPSIDELFILAYEDLVNSQKIDKGEAVKMIQTEFNKVLNIVFPKYYEIVAKWNYETESLELALKKFENIDLPFTSISHGESEIFSLIFSIFSTRNDQDIYLIDEPELHLNWMLEQGLFKFLDWFCKKYEKQIIISTHSRVVFEYAFMQKTQFISWENGKIVLSSTPTEIVKKRISGDIIKTISALHTDTIVFYVEDDKQQKVIDALSAIFQKEVFTSIVGNKPNVLSLCRYFETQNASSVFFLVDGDNENVPKELSKNNQLIWLNKYSIENYLLNKRILQHLSGKTSQQINKLISDSIIKSSSDKNTLVYKKMAQSGKISDDILDTFNSKGILSLIAKHLGYDNIDKYIEEYIVMCSTKKQLESVFGEITTKFNG